MGCIKYIKAFLSEGWWYDNSIFMDHHTIDIVYVFPELMVVSELRWKLELMVRHTIFNGGEE